MVDICKYYYKVGKDDPEDIPGVLTDICNYGIDQIDICTVKVLSDDRVDLKKRLKNQYFEKIRNSDDVIEFRGRIVEVRFANEDRYNLTFKVKSPLERLAKLSSHVTAEWLDTPGTITALDATTFTVSESVTEPPGYVASTSGVMIVPTEDSVFVEDEVDDITDFTAGATQDGLVGDINDDDPDTYLETYKDPQAVIYQVIEGTSTNAKASVIAMDYDVLVKVRVHSIYDCDVILYYYDYIGTQWVQLGDTVHVEDTNLAGNFYAEIKFKGCLEHNLGVDAATAAFKYKVEATYDGAIMAKIRIAIAEFNFYTDPKYKGTFFPITAYTAAKTLTVTGNPVTSRVEAGDTYVIGWKDSIVIAEIFDQYVLKKFIPFAVDIGTFNNSYTARSFWHLDLMSCLKYFMEKQRAHYWFDHPNDTLYIRTETAMTTEGANRALTTADVETFTHDDKESTAVSNIVFTGGTYKRGDGEDVTISYNYPRVWDGEWSGIGAYELIINKAGIKNWTEARDYVKNIYARLNSPNEMSITLNLFDYEDDIVVSDKVDLEIDGLVLVDEPVIKIDTSYDVGNDLAIKTLQVGWQHTSFTGILKNFWNDIVDSVEDLAQEIIETKVQRSKLLRVDGIIDGTNIIFDQVTIKNQGVGADSVLSSDSAVLELSLNAKLLLDGLETTNDIIIADGADLKLVFGDNDLIIRKTVDLPQVEIVGDIKVAVGHFLSESVYIGDQLLSEVAGQLTLIHPTPNITLKDSDTATNITAYLNFLDKDDVKRGYIGFAAGSNLFIQSADQMLFQATNGFKFYQTIKPFDNNVVDLGTDALEFKDIWIDGTAYLDTADITTLNIHNQGAGSDPVFTCNSHLDILDLTGDLRMSEDYLFKSGTAFDGLLSHNISAARTWILPDVAGTIITSANPTDLDHDALTNTHNLPRSVPSFVPFLGNGAVWNAFFCQPVIQMPSADNDCYFRVNLKIPDDWVDGSCTLKIMYSQDGANAYSVKWYVSALEATDNWVTEGYNVLNAAIGNDFPALTANIIYVKSITLTDANIKAGGSLGVFCQSDANNTDELYIMEVWIEQ